MSIFKNLLLIILTLSYSLVYSNDNLFEDYIESLKIEAHKNKQASYAKANSLVIRSEDRGTISSDWLIGYYTFNYGQYKDSKLKSFGALTVFNDEILKPNQGYDLKVDRMDDIITIPLSGTLIQENIDGDIRKLPNNEVQVLSSGNGIWRREYNPYTRNDLTYLQFHIKPNHSKTPKKYQAKYFDPCDRINTWQKIASPVYDDAELKLNQDAWIFRNTLEQNIESTYYLNKSNNGIYIFVLSGTVKVNGQILKIRDGMAVWNSGQLDVISLDHESDVLIVEVPL